MKKIKILLFIVLIILFSSCRSTLIVTLEQENLPIHIPKNSTVVFNNQIWTIGFGDGEQQVWSSHNGVNWSLRKRNPFVENPIGYALLNYNGKMWVLAGSNSIGSPKNKVWNSSDGVNWQLVSENELPFIRIEEAEVFNDKMLVFESNVGDPFGDSFIGTKIFSSTDGINWNLDILVTFMESDGATVSIFNNKLYLIGRSSRSFIPPRPAVPVERKIYRSEDGINWLGQIYPSDHYIFSLRTDHSSVVFDNNIWVIGGLRNVLVDGRIETRLTDDIWYSIDTQNWRKYSRNPPFSGIRNHTTINFNNKIWLLGGTKAVYDGTTLSYVSSNDVWSIKFNED